MSAPEPSTATAATVRCPACGPIEAADQRPVPFMTAYVSLLKDWRTWAAAAGVVLVVGLVCGALGLPTGSVGAGGGAVLGLALSSRAMSVRQCGRCGALAR